MEEKVEGIIIKADNYKIMCSYVALLVAFKEKLHFAY